MKIATSREALQAFRSLRPASVWAQGEIDPSGMFRQVGPGDGGHRVYAGFPSPVVQPKFTISPDAGIFTAGSCFAREIEKVLHARGLNLLSWANGAGLEDVLLHRYTTHAIAAEFQFALEGTYDPANIVPFRDRWFDYTGHGEAPSREALLDQRLKVINLFKQSAKADVIVLTLGLVETWFDTQTKSYTNIAPWSNFLGGRFELHVTDYAENRRVLEQLIGLLRTRIRRDIKIVLTVSPVPLSQTFGGQDIIVANTYSKSVLRAVAQDLAQGDPFIDYFPSYEMVTLADPTTTWFPDHRHVLPEFVAQIMDAFLIAYMPDVAGTTESPPP